MEPLLVVWLAIACVVAVFSVSRLRRLRLAQGAVDRPSVGEEVMWSARCGVTVREPGRAVVSYPVGRLDVLADAVVVSWSCGTYRFDAAASVAARSSAISVLGVVELRDDSRRVEVHIRRREELMGRLEDLGWATG